MATIRAEDTVLGNSCVFQTEASAEVVGVVSTESGDAVRKGEGRATYVGWAGGQGGGALTKGFSARRQADQPREWEGDGACPEPQLPGASLGLRSQ